MPLLAAVLVLSAAFQGPAAFQTSGLTIGSPAPPLSIKTWLKGAPIRELDPKGTYVVEFWATWCGPCREGMPHLTALAKANPDVTFLGVGIWEDEKGDDLRKFVAGMGEKMGYRVAYSGNEEGMAKTWMRAARRDAIPCAFIVREGRIAWIGHPGSLDEPLAKIKAGTFDAGAARAELEGEAAVKRKEAEVEARIGAAQELFKAGKRAEARAALDAVLKTNPEAKMEVEPVRLGWLLAEDPAAWEAKIRGYARSSDEDGFRFMGLMTLGWSSSPELRPWARRMVQVALAENPESFLVQRLAAFIYEGTEDYALAIAASEKALKLLPTTKYADPEFEGEIREELKELRAKLAAGPATGAAPAKSYGDAPERLAAAQTLFDAGKRTEALASLGPIEADVPDYASRVQEKRFDWLAETDPKAWEVYAREYIRQGAERAKGTAKDVIPQEWMYVGMFASERARTPAKDPAGAKLARRAMELLVAASPTDFRTVGYAYGVYTMLGDDAQALAAVEILVAHYGDLPAQTSAEYKASLVKARDALRAKLKKG